MSFHALPSVVLASGTQRKTCHQQEELRIVSMGPLSARSSRPTLLMVTLLCSKRTSVFTFPTENLFGTWRKRNTCLSPVATAGCPLRSKSHTYSAIESQMHNQFELSRGSSRRNREPFRHVPQRRSIRDRPSAFCDMNIASHAHHHAPRTFPSPPPPLHSQPSPADDHGRERARAASGCGPPRRRRPPAPVPTPPAAARP